MSAARPSRRLLLFGLPAIALAALAVLAVPAAAHEHVHIDPYAFVIGWTTEPAIVGSVNGLDMSITYHGAANSTEPVVGVEGDLTATLSSGGQSVVKALEPKFGVPGSYTFDVIPSREGTYTLRIAGTVNGTAVNFTVDLQSPEPRADLEFPASDVTNEQLAAQFADATSRLAAAEAAVATMSSKVAAAEANAAAAQSAASQSSPATATMIGLLALALGAVGAGLGSLAWRATKK